MYHLLSPRVCMKGRSLLLLKQIQSNILCTFTSLTYVVVFHIVKSVCWWALSTRLQFLLFFMSNMDNSFWLITDRHHNAWAKLRSIDYLWSLGTVLILWSPLKENLCMKWLVSESFFFPYLIPYLLFG